MVRHVLVMGNGYGTPPGKRNINVSSPEIGDLCVCVSVGVFSTHLDPLQYNTAVYTVLLLPFIDKKTLNRQTGPTL